MYTEEVPVSRVRYNHASSIQTNLTPFIMYKKKIQAVTKDELNKILERLKDTSEIVYDSPDNREGVVGYRTFVVIKQSKVEVTTRVGGKVITYILRLDGEDATVSEVNGFEAWRIGQRYYKVPEMSIRPFSAKPLLYYNKEYEKQRIHAYMYDINSAYATVMSEYRFPDTSVEPDSKKVGKDEIGFDGDGNLVHEGKFAYWVFPLMESPYKKFVEVWYNRKKNATTAKEKAKAKSVLNYYVGMLQKHNCFLRAYIVNSCSELVRSLMDDNTLMSNTDSIVSLKPLPLKIGKELGEWKFEEGAIAYVGNNYQWNDDMPKYRGVPRGWFKKGFDILKDKAPSFGNIYKLDKDKFKVIEIDYKEE